MVVVAFEVLEQAFGSRPASHPTRMKVVDANFDGTKLLFDVVSELGAEPTDQV